MKNSKNSCNPNLSLEEQHKAARLKLVQLSVDLDRACEELKAMKSPRLKPKES